MFFFHSSISGHLGWFHILVNISGAFGSATVSLISILLYIYPGVELLNHMAGLFFIF